MVSVCPPFIQTSLRTRPAVITDDYDGKPFRFLRVGVGKMRRDIFWHRRRGDKGRRLKKNNTNKWRLTGQNDSDRSSPAESCGAPHQECWKSVARVHARL